MKYSEELYILKDHLDNLDLEAHGTQAIGDCPYCGKRDHFYLNKYNWMHDCKKCGESGNLKKISIQLDIEHLFEDIGVKKKNLHSVSVMDFSKILVEQELISVTDKFFEDHYKMIDIGGKYYKYLKSRGYSRDYIILNRQLFWEQSTNEGRDDYLILPIKQGSNVMGFVARLIWSNSHIDEFNLSIEQRFVGDDKMIKRFSKKRYKNSFETKFAQLLYGIDGVRKKHTVIIVEGNFDKLNVYIFIDKYNLGEFYSCVCTFGKKLSKGQIKLLKDKGVEKVLFMYDRDASETLRNKSVIYMKSFKESFITFITKKDSKGNFLDPGASKPKVIKKAVKNKIHFSSFVTDSVDIKSFKENSARSK